MPMRRRQQCPSPPDQRSMYASICFQPRRLKYPTQKSARSAIGRVSRRAGSSAWSILSKILGMRVPLSDQCLWARPISLGRGVPLLSLLKSTNSNSSCQIVSPIAKIDKPRCSIVSSPCTTSVQGVSSSDQYQGEERACQRLAAILLAHAAHTHANWESIPCKLPHSSII